MKRLSRHLLTWVLLGAVSFFPLAGVAADKLPVVASFSILGDLVQAVGGERVKVSTLVGPNADAHAFEPTPADAKTILNARLVVINGLNFEPWVQKLAQSAAYRGDILVASQGIEPRALAKDQSSSRSDPDPHAWQDPQSVMIYVKNIAKSLSTLDPSGASSYHKNSDSYIRELEALDQFAKTQFAPLAARQRQVITSHDAFGYFAARYQIRFLAPLGLSPEVEPSAKGVAQLIRQIQHDKTRAVFVENMSNPKLLAQISRDTGITLGPKLYVDALSGPTEPGSTYLKMMRYNITQLAAGMRLN